ncbi:MAG TPA: hypothetical protein VN703_03320, partial [Candidatus Sulfopaludibacter sp.]|nr:hypothetical protein [Candidatus Sulfopaludibacter sp.]
NSNVTSDFTISNTNINITDIPNLMEKNTEIPVEKNNEILIEEDSDDETDQINIENEFGEYLQGWSDMLNEEELANGDDDSDDTVNNIIHPAVDINAKWMLETLFKNDFNLLF